MSWKCRQICWANRFLVCDCVVKRISRSVQLRFIEPTTTKKCELNHTVYVSSVKKKNQVKKFTSSQAINIHVKYPLESRTGTRVFHQPNEVIFVYHSKPRRVNFPLPASSSFLASDILLLLLTESCFSFFQVNGTVAQHYVCCDSIKIRLKTVNTLDSHTNFK